MKTLGKNSLSSFLKKIVNIAWYMQLAAAGVVVLFTILLAFGVMPENIQMRVLVDKPGTPDTEQIIKDALSEKSGPDAWSVLKSMNTGKLLLGGSLILAFFILSLYITFLLRKILNSLSEGVPFTLENSRRIRFISYAIMASAPLGFIFEQLTIDPVVNTLGQHHFSVSFSLSDFTNLFLGGIVFIIAEIFKVGYTMQEEQKLVI